MRCAAVALLLGALHPAAATEVKLAIGDLAAPDFALKGATATLTVGEAPRLTIDIDTLTVRGSEWRKVRLDCARLGLTADVIDCREGALQLAGERVPARFSYHLQRRALDATLFPSEGERWRVDARFGGREPRIDVEVTNGRLARLAPWLPAGVPKISGGTLSGTAALGEGGAVRGEIVLDGLAFSDATGTRAGEGITARLQIGVGRDASAWKWQASGEWRAGEVFWQPVYLKASGQRVEAEGTLDDSRITAQRARAEFPAIGQVEVSGVAWDRSAQRLDAGRVAASKLPLAEVYAQWLKPFFAGTALSDLRAAGEFSIDAEMRDGELRSLVLDLADASLEDSARRFALFGATGRIPWRRDAETSAEIALDGGEALKVPFGAFTLPLALHGERVAVSRASVPLLGGQLTVSDFFAARGDTGWRWQFGGELAPVSVDRLTQLLGWPAMHGTLSGRIPRARYERSTLTIEGALVFNVFDGTVTARNVALIEPLGLAPRLDADLQMSRLDLDLLTRTFSFGSMTGRVDATVAGLELVDWQPVRFDARIESSPGDYRRTISQTAVENISALGGAGAAAAIQRSFLRFFDRFGYEKLGLTCVLRNGVCTMGGIEPAPQGSGYVIVKGGGIPALSVIGYNRNVSWPELVTRLKRIMQDNVRAIVK